MMIKLRISAITTIIVIVYYADITWAQWGPKSSDTGLLGQQFFVEIDHYYPFPREIYRRFPHKSHKRPAVQKASPRHDVNMINYSTIADQDGGGGFKKLAGHYCQLAKPLLDNKYNKLERCFEACLAEPSCLSVDFE